MASSEWGVVEFMAEVIVPEIRRRCQTLLFDGLDGGGHGAFAAGDEVVFAEGVNLVALELSMFSGSGEDDDVALGVDFGGDLHALFNGMAEELLHHIDDVVVGVVVVVPEDDVVRGLSLGFFLFSALRSGTV